MRVKSYESKTITKKCFFQPRTMIVIFLVLALWMFSSALIELNQSKKELLDSMEKQAHTMLETVITSSNNALLTYKYLEIFLEERLLNADMPSRSSRAMFDPRNIKDGF